MFSLPKPVGPHDVGLHTLVHNVYPRRAFGTARAHADGERVLEADAVVMNVFYPCEAKPSARAGAPWVDQPMHAAVAGTAHFTGVSQWAIWPLTALYSSRLQMPVFKDAPLLKAKHGRWRLIIFSHGLAGSKTMYSQLAANLASHGFVVIAMEHRDRSGMLFMSRDGQPRIYTKPEEILWDKPDADKFTLRNEQLEFRRFEIYTAFAVFRDMVSGRPCELHELDDGPIDASEWVDAVECDADVVLAGHSFGACTLLSLLSNPPLEGHERMPISHALALDPWFEPLRNPGPMPANWPDDIPLCIIDSEAFTLWKEHFAWAGSLIESWPAQASFFTFVKARHDSFSDMVCLVPFQRAKFAKIFAGIVTLSHAFIEDRLQETTKRLDIAQMEEEISEKRGKTIRSLRGTPGQVVIHHR